MMMIIFVNADDEINKITTEDTKHDNDDDNDGLVVHGSHVLLCPGAETSGWRVSCFMPPNNFNNNCFNNLQH